MEDRRDRLWLVLIVTYALLGMAGHCEGSKILFLPIDHHPHVNFFALTAKSMQQAGHNVTILTMDQHKELLMKHGVPHILHSGVQAKATFEEHDQLAEMSFRGRLKDLLQIPLILRDLWKMQCKEVLESVELSETLDNMKFDLAVVEAVEMWRCVYIIPYRLGIPYITLTARYEPWLARVPALPSVEGFLGLYNMPDNSSFKDRIANTALHIIYNIVAPRVVDDTMVADYASNKPAITYSELFQKSEMILVNLDTLCLDTPRVTSPHYQFIGGMNNRPAEPLPAELEQFVNSAEHGIIIVSFGSVIKIMPDFLFDKLLDGFGQVRQKIIMRYHGNGTHVLDSAKLCKVPSNVKLTEWLPQNDILGHSKTRLFITHAGNNGQLEAIYHGVPMLSIPLFDDQFYDATRAEARGFGLSLDWRHFTSNELVDSIKEIITNPKYQNNIRKCMEITKDFPTPQERITFWIEHVLKFGSSHLRPPYMDMPLWKFFMLDVAFVLALLFGLLIYISCRFCCFLGNRVGKSSTKHKTA